MITMSYWLAVTLLAASALLATILTSWWDGRAGRRLEDEAYSQGWDDRDADLIAEISGPSTAALELSSATAVQTALTGDETVILHETRQRWTDQLCRQQNEDTQAYLQRMTDEVIAAQDVLLYALGHGQEDDGPHSTLVL